MSTHGPADSLSLLRLVPALALAGLLPGCALPEEVSRPMAQKESVLAGLFSPTTEFDAVLWASDEFDADKRARGTALLAFSPVGGKPDYVKLFYLRYLTDKDSNVRAAAVFALALHGSPDHATQIAPLLKDADPAVRLNAARTLQRLHNTAAIDGLIDAVDDTKEDNAAVRAEAADALGQYAENRVLEKLITTLDDPALIVNQGALRSLRTLTGEDLGEDRRDWSRWSQQTREPFVHQGAYTYPVFSRDKRLIEWLPFMPPPPNETAGQPVGMPPVGGG